MNNINRNNRVSTTNEGTIDKKGEKSEQKSTAKGKKKNFFYRFKDKKKQRLRSFRSEYLASEYAAPSSAFLASSNAHENKEKFSKKVTRNHNNRITEREREREIRRKSIGNAHRWPTSFP